MTDHKQTAAERAANLTSRLMINSTDEGTCSWVDHLELLPKVQEIIEAALDVVDAGKASVLTGHMHAGIERDCPGCRTRRVLKRTIAAFDKAIGDA